MAPLLPQSIVRFFTFRVVLLGSRSLFPTSLMIVSENRSKQFLTVKLSRHDCLIFESPSFAHTAPDHSRLRFQSLITQALSETRFPKISKLDFPRCDCPALANPAFGCLALAPPAPAKVKAEGNADAEVSSRVWNWEFAVKETSVRKIEKAGKKGVKIRAKFKWSVHIKSRPGVAFDVKVFYNFNHPRLSSSMEIGFRLRSLICFLSSQSLYSQP